MNARQAIIKALYEASEPLPVHGLGLVGVSETAASARLREMAREGIVAGFTKPGARYKLWLLKPSVPQGAQL